MLWNIEKIVEQLQDSRAGKKVVLCSGTFDLLHPGHIKFLTHTKRRADILVVGVNSDEIVSRRKGPERPIVPEQSRAFIVSALACVDYTFIIPHGLSKEEIIHVLKPDIVAFNNDFFRSGEHLKRHEFLKTKFPDVDFVYVENRERTDGWSTTEIINKIRSQK